MWHSTGFTNTRTSVCPIGIVCVCICVFTSATFYLSMNVCVLYIHMYVNKLIAKSRFRIIIKFNFPRSMASIYMRWWWCCCCWFLFSFSYSPTFLNFSLFFPSFHNHCDYDSNPMRILSTWNFVRGSIQWFHTVNWLYALSFANWFQEKQFHCWLWMELKVVNVMK